MLAVSFRVISEQQTFMYFFNTIPLQFHYCHYELNGIFWRMSNETSGCLTLKGFQRLNFLVHVDKSCPGYQQNTTTVLPLLHFTP